MENNIIQNNTVNKCSECENQFTPVCFKCSFKKLVEKIIPDDEIVDYDVQLKLQA